MLTTVDNPFNPYTDYDGWYAYDAWLGHHTPSYLARIVHSSDELSEADQVAAIDSAISEIISNDELNIYRIAVDPADSKN